MKEIALGIFELLKIKTSDFHQRVFFDNERIYFTDTLFVLRPGVAGRMVTFI
jgi:hypothetical protein